MANLPVPQSKQDALEELKNILLSDDQQRIEQLESSLLLLRDQLTHKEQLIETLEPVLLELLDRKIHNSKDAMARSLAPVINVAIKQQVLYAKEDIIDALYPLVGRLVSKSVSEAMKKIVANINSSVNRTFDMNYWKRRVKARMAGVSAGEFMMAEAAPFDVHGVFLIARQSGLLISYVTRDESAAEHNDAQVIGGMLTAIKSFVETSFHDEKEGELREIAHSNWTIRIESGLHTYLAVVYSGMLAAGFSEQLQECHGKIHSKFHHKLRNFDGDSAGLLNVDSPLKELIAKTRLKNHG